LSIILHTLRRWWSHHPGRFFLAASAALVILFYGQALTGRFVYDDIDQILNNEALRSWPLTFSHYLTRGVPFSSDYLAGPAGVSYRPLFWLSLALDYRLFGNNPIGFHITNLVLHWVNGCLGFLLLQRLGVPVKRAAAAACVWLLMPINSEVVAWISGRAYSLATSFLLGGLLATERYLRKKEISSLVLLTFAQLLALLSQELGILLFPLMLLLVFTRRISLRAAVFPLALIGACDLAYLGLRSFIQAPSSAHLWNLAAVGPAFWKYLLWIILPIDMSVERSTDMPGFGWSAWSVLSTVALLAVLFFAVRRLIKGTGKTAPELPWAAGWTFLSLLPFTGAVFVYQGMAERYTYVASLGVATALVAMTWILYSKKSKVLASCLMVWLAWSAWRLETRVRSWHDEISLFSSSLEATPNSPLLLYSLALAMEQAGDMRTSFLLTKRALTLRPKYEKALNGLGGTYLRLNQVENAKKQFEQAFSVNPNDPVTLGNLGTVYMRQGSFEKAKDFFTRALTSKPRDFQLLSNLGSVDAELGEFVEAKTALERAIKIAPDEVIARCNLAMLLFRQGQWEKASEQLAIAIRRKPNDPEPYYFFGLIDQEMGVRAAAIEMFKHAVRLKPDFVEAQAKLVELNAN
jgi:protein O-mannosyl-transferase